MPIISISLNDEILNELDACKKTMGFSGRSEIIRAGIRAFVADEKQKNDLTGHINAIMLVIHDDDYDNIASELSHDYEDNITTRMHSKIEGKKCMELFVLKGPANKIIDMVKKYQTNKNMDTSKMVVL